jgi:hypothetical protein
MYAETNAYVLPTQLIRGLVEALNPSKGAGGLIKPLTLEVRCLVTRHQKNKQQTRCERVKQTRSKKSAFNH